MYYTIFISCLDSFLCIPSLIITCISDTILLLGNDKGYYSNYTRHQLKKGCVCDVTSCIYSLIPAVLFFQSHEKNTHTYVPDMKMLKIIIIRIGPVLEKHRGKRGRWHKEHWNQRKRWKCPCLMYTCNKTSISWNTDWHHEQSQILFSRSQEILHILPTIQDLQ